MNSRPTNSMIPVPKVTNRDGGNAANCAPGAPEVVYIYSLAHRKTVETMKCHTEWAPVWRCPTCRAVLSAEKTRQHTGKCRRTAIVLFGGQNKQSRWFTFARSCPAAEEKPSVSGWLGRRVANLVRAIGPRKNWKSLPTQRKKVCRYTKYPGCRKHLSIRDAMGRFTDRHQLSPKLTVSGGLWQTLPLKCLSLMNHWALFEKFISLSDSIWPSWWVSVKRP